ncbi:MAG: alpha/beta hydrolase, partial [Saprospiraceae bacterium]|nr:alpha/beta hydrolase [Saprospiraceae bacterium]
MRKFCLLACLFPFLAIGQPPIDRYQDSIFTNYTETTNILFSTGVPQPEPGGGFYEWVTGYPLNVDEYNTSPVDLEMNIFLPSGDTLSKRPLIIICFGGGFLSGSKDHWSIRLLCERLAKYGFVTAAIDYRLGMNIFDSDLANRAVYRGLQDARSAVRFFRADAAGTNTYKIDPNQIFVGGHSSGAFMALHNAYLDKESERPLSTYEWTQDGNLVPDQLCLDCVGDNQSFDGHANGIFSLAGAVGFTSFIEGANDPKVAMFHSIDDGTVPYYSGEPFSDISILVFGSDLPEVHGSFPISQQADIVGLPYQFFSYTNRGHGVHEDDPDLYMDIIPGISDWFFNEELKPTHEILYGDTSVCSATAQQSYILDDGTGFYFDWVVNGGILVNPDNYSSNITVLWDPGASDRSLTVVPYSCLDAKGDTVVLEVEWYDSGVNVFLGVTNLWSNSGNWSLGHLPTYCEDVEIVSSLGLPTLEVSTEANIHSLF